MEAEVATLHALTADAAARWRRIAAVLAIEDAFATLKAARARGEIIFAPDGRFKGTITGDEWISWFEWAASKIE
jgi:hypothetical protein